MSIPKEVIQDLLPIYLAGEASPATRAWLEERLAEDPELAERVRRQGTETLPGASLPPLAPELELRALKSTRRKMTQLRWLFGLAMWFSAIPLSTEITFHPFRIRFLMLDYFAVFIPCLAIGVACWIAYFRLRRRLRVSGI